MAVVALSESNRTTFARTVLLLGCTLRAARAKNHPHSCVVMLILLRCLFSNEVNKAVGPSGGSSGGVPSARQVELKIATDYPA